MKPPAPARLILDRAALIANWRTLADLSGSADCGAAVKADGYGLGAVPVAQALVEAGCRGLFASTWAEAAEVAGLGAQVSVLHGVRAEDMVARDMPGVRPVLNTPNQVRRWREGGGGVCDVMIDTGMNRLGLSVADVAAGLLDGLTIDTLMSHLACADSDSSMNAAQQQAMAGLRGATGARRLSLANSAGIALGKAYAFDLTRPGIALYGGVPRGELAGKIAQVARIEAQVLQRRIVAGGDSVGYDATWTARVDTPVGTLNLGYADGYRRAFSDRGTARAGDAVLPILGRVSMDMIAVDLAAAPHVGEGDWLAIDYALPQASAASGVSQYELLTGLGRRFDRVWK